MSRIETILIGIDDPFAKVVAAVARGLDTAPVPARTGAEDDFQFVLDDTADVTLEDWRLGGDAVDEPIYDGITYELDVRDTAGVERQIQTARRVYTLLTRATPWKVVLLLDGLVEATRPALEPA